MRQFASVSLISSSPKAGPRPRLRSCGRTAGDPDQTASAAPSARPTDSGTWETVMLRVGAFSEAARRVLMRGLTKKLPAKPIGAPAPAAAPAPVAAAEA